MYISLSYDVALISSKPETRSSDSRFSDEFSDDKVASGDIDVDIDSALFPAADTPSSPLQIVLAFSFAGRRRSDY